MFTQSLTCTACPVGGTGLFWPRLAPCHGTAAPVGQQRTQFVGVRAKTTWTASLSLPRTLQGIFPFWTKAACGLDDERRAFLLGRSNCLPLVLHAFCTLHHLQALVFVVAGLIALHALHSIASDVGSGRRPSAPASTPAPRRATIGRTQPPASGAKLQRRRQGSCGECRRRPVRPAIGGRERLGHAGRTSWP